jgi:hypothetical protein
MPALDITVDGAKVATVSTDGLDVLGVNIGGTQVDEELASLDVSGGRYPEGGAPISLTWVACAPLRPGQCIGVTFHESGQSSQPGKTIEELFPDEPRTEQIDFTPTAEMFNELRAKPKLREKFQLRLRSSSGASFVGETAPAEHGFGFSVLWNSFHPERARVSLHAYTLDSLESRSPFNNLFEEKITYEGSVELHVA